MTESAVVAVFFGVCTFFVGGAIGALTMKNATEEDVSSLREQLSQRNAEREACCEVAYVLQKYRHEDCQAQP